MTPREQYLRDATSWSHHNPYTEKPRSGVFCPFSDYEVFPGWQVIIIATTECNASCKHCYLPQKGSFEPKYLKKLIGDLRDYGYSVFLDGAEPLLNRDYLAAYKAADQKFAATNGMVICEKPEYIYELREAGIETLGVSYHFEMHGAFGCIHPRLAETALGIAETANVKGCVMTTITKPFVKNIPQYCEWCVERGFREIRFSNFIAQRRAQRLDRDLILSADDRKFYYEIISQERAKYDEETLKIVSSGSFGDCGSPNVNCTAMRDFVVMTPDYKVYPCRFQTSPGMECGTYRNGFIFTKKYVHLPEHDCASIHLFND